jgi:hypothetical protein
MARLDVSTINPIEFCSVLLKSGNYIKTCCAAISFHIISLVVTKILSLVRILKYYCRVYNI